MPTAPTRRTAALPRLASGTRLLIVTLPYRTLAGAEIAPGDTRVTVERSTKDTISTHATRTTPALEIDRWSGRVLDDARTPGQRFAVIDAKQGARVRHHHALLRDVLRAFGDWSPVRHRLSTADLEAIWAVVAPHMPTRPTGPRPTEPRPTGPRPTGSRR